MTDEQVEIVVVDDAVEMARALGDMLELDGYRVRVATSGEEALAFVAQKRPLGVLLDIDMPVITGYELAKTLRERFGGEMVLVAFTGLGDQTQLVMKTLPLVDDFLKKPVSPAQLRKLFPPIVRG